MYSQPTLRYLSNITILLWLTSGLALLLWNGPDRLLEIGKPRLTNPVLVALDATAPGLRSRGTTRLLMAVGPRSGSAIPLAHHLFYPQRIVETARHKRSTTALKIEAAERGCDGLLWYGEDGAWHLKVIQP